eukprot:NODE_3461_length_783_cov_297.068681.p1 GENE.NODE_3461_length_783_cov_297.068681~~NODE_3461_length_783_cov_297.068681.p1  ORF type:complete len:191 (+),score=55.85 NODE_3461_length_783_cov_297.068681:3-575(+)
MGDHTLYKSKRENWIFFEGVYNARFQVGYSGGGIFMISRDTLGLISADVPEGVRGRPDYWDVDTSYGKLEERRVALASAPGFAPNLQLRVILTRVEDKAQFIRGGGLPAVPEQLRLKLHDCQGKKSELERWSDVLAVGPANYSEPTDAIVEVKPDDGPMAVGELGRFVAAAAEAAARGVGIAGPCLILEA